MIYRDIEQRSADWMKMRCGCFTSSRTNDGLAKLHDPKKEAANRKKYKSELVIERLTGNTYPHHVTPEMQWGIETEPIARAEYEIATGNDVTPIGLALHPTIKWFAASTDGLIGDDGILEIKCLNSMNHLDIMETGEIPEQYHWQMLGGMACTERQWCDFVSYDPRLPEGYQIFIRRFKRDDALIRGMELEVVQFLSEVEQRLERLKSRNREALQEAIA